MPYREQMIERIYEAATEPEKWPALLEEMGNMVQAPSGVLLMRRSDQWVGWQMSPSVPGNAQAYLTSEHPAKSLTTPRLLAANHAGFLRESDVMTEEEFLNDPYMVAWGAPNGLHHCASTAFVSSSGDVAVMQFMRKKGLPPMSRLDLDLLDSFRPHIVRAGLLAARWRMQRLQTATDALEMLGLPAAVLDHRGVVLTANRLLEQARFGLKWLPNDRIALETPNSHRLLRLAIADLSRTAAGVTRSIPVPAAQARNACILHLIPAKAGVSELFDNGHAFLVVTPLSPGPTSIPTLEGLFDLTPTEARVARKIAEGHTMEQIALDFDVSRETVRTHMKAIFSKTGVNKQAQVAALIAGVPRIPLCGACS